MDYQIVVARYNEDITYLSLFSNIIIVYNKGNNNLSTIFNSINLPNIGRESHTYLYHIIQNYDNLANKTLFIQGHVHDHKLLPFNEYFNNESFTARKSILNMNIFKNNINHSGKFLKDLQKGNLKKSKYTPYQWLQTIGIDLSNNITQIDMVWGANFAVSKDLILSKPKIFYENIIKYVEYDSNPEEGHFFERSWYLIFNNKLLIKKKIIYFIIHNVNDLNYINNINIDNTISELFEIHIWCNKFISNNIFSLKFINNMSYININPYIENNSIKLNLDLIDSTNINNHIFLKLKFKSNTIDTLSIFEIKLSYNNCYLYDVINDKLIANYTKYINFNNFDLIIKWDNIFVYFINKHNNITLFKTNMINPVLINIDIKSNSDLYLIYDNTKSPYLFYTRNIDINNYYKNHYEEYYIEEYDML